MTVMLDRDRSTNGRAVTSPPLQPDLPADRKAAVEYGLSQFQAIAAERDRYAVRVHELESELAAHRVELDGRERYIAEMESRVNSAMLVRDQAVADRAKYETMFISVFAQLRAFNVPAAPLVKETRPPEQQHDEDFREVESQQH